MASPVNERLALVARHLQSQFLGKDEIVRLLLVSIAAGEHCVLVGPPGTAKSALIRNLAGSIQATYFEYLLTRFTEPNEIFGPVDIAAFRDGVYRRNTAGMLPEAQVVFLDEIFRSNSAILNALLTLLNERKFMSGGQVVRCPLISVFAASNEVPADESLAAVFDRFLLRVHSDNLESFHFHELIDLGLQQEARTAEEAPARHFVSAAEVAAVGRSLVRNASFGSEFLATYKGLVLQIRAEGVSLSDRRVIKLLKLCAASAFLDGRTAADAGDLFVLKHVWNAPDQAALLEALVQPVLDAFYRDQPSRRGTGDDAPGFRSGVGRLGASLRALEAEVDRIRELLTGGGGMTDVQLFSQLKALGEIRAALGTLHEPEARELEGRVAALLEASFRTGRFAQL